MGIGTIIASLVSIVIAVAVVGALAFGFIYVLRLWQDRSLGRAEQRGAGPTMSFMRALPLGQSERLVLVEVGDEVLLVGVASHGVSLLKSWPRAELPASVGGSEGGFGSPAADLAARFRNIPGLGGRERQL